jgi:hypothetical protein
VRRRSAAVSWTVLLTIAVPAAAGAQNAADHPVQVQMRNVGFHVDSTIVLDIAYARGRLKRMAPDHPPFLDDKRSFVLVLDSARIGISPAALSGLLNRYTFAYPGSPLRRLTITIEHGRLRQHGTMRGISFDVVGDLSLTPEGELRLHPTTIKAVGIKVGGLIKLFGLNLQKLVNTEHARGVRIEGDDFLLSPTTLLPPPAVEGRVGRVEVNDSQIVQIFRPADGHAVDPLVLPIPKTPNYMFFRGGVRQADHGRHRPLHRGCGPGGPLRLLARPLQRPISGGRVTEHAGSRPYRGYAGFREAGPSRGLNGFSVPVRPPFRR